MSQQNVDLMKSARLGGEWEGFKVTFEEVHDAGDTVVVTGRYTGAYKKTGPRIHAQFAHVWRKPDPPWKRQPRPPG
jgi:hypothetical protein